MKPTLKKNIYIYIYIFHHKNLLSIYPQTSCYFQLSHHFAWMLGKLQQFPLREKNTDSSIFLLAAMHTRVCVQVSRLITDDESRVHQPTNGGKATFIIGPFSSRDSYIVFHSFPTHFFRYQFAFSTGRLLSIATYLHRLRFIVARSTGACCLEEFDVDKEIYKLLVDFLQGINLSYSFRI